MNSLALETQVQHLLPFSVAPAVLQPSHAHCRMARRSCWISGRCDLLRSEEEQARSRHARTRHALMANEVSTNKAGANKAGTTCCQEIAAHHEETAIRWIRETEVAPCDREGVRESTRRGKGTMRWCGRYGLFPWKARSGVVSWSRIRHRREAE